MTGELSNEKVKEALHSILAKEHGIEGEVNPAFRELPKPNTQRSRIYQCSLGDINICAKDYYDWGKSKDITGTNDRPVVDEENEEKSLELMTGLGGFVPRFYGTCEFFEGSQLHRMYFMEWYERNLDDVLVELKKQKDETDDPHQKEMIEKKASELLKKALDIIVVNNHLLFLHYSREEMNIRDLDNGYLEEDIDTSLYKLFDYVAQCSPEGHRFIYHWVMQEPKLRTILHDKISKSLGTYRNRRPVFYAPYPTHILINPHKISGGYTPESILEIKEGRKEGTPYDGIALGDLTKIGMSVPELSYAMPSNHPVALDVFDDPEKMVFELTDHALHAQEMVEGEKIFANNFKKRFDNASRYVIFRNLSFISSLMSRSLETYDQEKAAQFESEMGLTPEQYNERLMIMFMKKPIYSPENFIGASANRFAAINSTNTFKPVERVLSRFSTEVKKAKR